MKVVTHKRLHSTCFIFDKKSRIGKSMAIDYKFTVPYGWGHRDPSRGSVQFSSVAQSCPTLHDPMTHSTPGFPVNH